MVDIWHFLGSNRVLYLLWNAAVPDLPMDDPLNFVNQSLTIFWLTFIKHIVEKAKEMDLQAYITVLLLLIIPVECSQHHGCPTLAWTLKMSWLICPW